MITLLSELKFWTLSGDINIKDGDFGASKYNLKKDISINGQTAAADKQDYMERRNNAYCIDKRLNKKLKQSLRKLEDYLRNFKIIYKRWSDNKIIQLFLSNGLIVHICLDITTGDVVRIAFDKFFLGKLITETVSDVIITRLHILIAYNLNQITLVYLQKPNLKQTVPEKISHMEPKIFNIIINGSQNRNLPRHLTINCTSDYLAIWTKSSQNEIYPWRPTIKDQDRANLHIYKLNKIKLEPMCYFWTENDPINIEFSKTNQQHIQSVEQKVSKKGDVLVEICVYELTKSKLLRIAITSIPLQAQVVCHSFSPDNEKLMIGCIDSSIVIFDINRGITHLVRASFIPTLISWHCDSILLCIANERCQLQFFDVSLAVVKNQLICEDSSGSFASSIANILDLSSYFQQQQPKLKSTTVQQHLQSILWNKKPDLIIHNDYFTQTDCFLLLLFENVPSLACLRIFGGTGLRGDIHTSGFTGDVLIHQYLNMQQIEKAINLLLCLNWDSYGEICLMSLHKIANFILRHPLTVDRELQFQKALGSFHVPVKALRKETELEFGDQVRDITRKYFMYLLRFKSYEKAFSLAIDIDDEDIFMDLYNCAKSDGGFHDLAMDAFNKAEEILARIEDTNSSSSYSSCSDDCDGNHDVVDDESSIIGNSSETNLKIHRLKDPKKSMNDKLSLDSTIIPTIPRFSINSMVGKQYLVPTKTTPSPSILYDNHMIISTVPSDKRKNIRDNPLYNLLDNLPEDEYLIPASISTNTLSISATSASLSSSSHMSSQNKLSSYSNYLLYNTPSSTSTTTTPNQLNDILDLDYPVSPSHNFESNYYYYKNLSLTNKLSQQTLPRIQFSNHNLNNPNKQHTVIDIFPKPIGLSTTTTVSSSPSSLSQTPSTTSKPWTVPDQTIGIPISTNVLDGYGVTLKHGQYNSNISNSVPVIYNGLPVIHHQHPIVLGNIPASLNLHNPVTDVKRNTTSSLSTISKLKDIPNNNTIGSILTNNQMSSNLSTTVSASVTALSSRKESGEKNKVKFSDTVQVAVVPEIPRKDKPIERTRRTNNNFNNLLTNPRKELEDSLPLCHPNDVYLKDFTPMPIADIHDNETTNNPSDDNNNNTNNRTNSIKVIHFGVV